MAAITQTGLKNRALPERFRSMLRTTDDQFRRFMGMLRIRRMPVRRSPSPKGRVIGRAIDSHSPSWRRLHR